MLKCAKQMVAPTYFDFILWEIKMKLAVLHISDSHFQEKEQINEQKINAIVQSLNQIGNFQRLIICYTGDIAYQGLDIEYQYASQFVGRLLRLISSEHDKIGYIPVYCVPGNHDFDYADLSTRTRTDIYDLYQKNGINDLFIKNELTHLSNYYNFVDKKRYNTCNEFYSSAEEKARIHVGANTPNTVKINMINSTFFAVKHDDKGIHYIPDKYISSIADCGKSDFAITLMHHSPEWYGEQIKHKLESSIYNSTSLLLLGHEHHSLGKYIDIDVNNNICIMAGGILSNGTNSSDSTYNIANIDLLNKTVTAFRFEWNMSGGLYVGNKIIDSTYRRKRYQNYSIDLNSDYEQTLTTDSQINLGRSLLDYFVFPSLTQIDAGNKVAKDTVVDIETLMDDIKHRQITIIEGDDSCGKTTFSKYLFYRLYHSYHFTPILLTMDLIKGARFDKVIQRAFWSQYSSDPTAYACYEQLPKYKKIVIIDDLHYIDDKICRRFMDYLCQNQFKIILLTKTAWEVDIVQQVEEKLVERTDLLKFRIEPFHNKKRKELITNVCLVRGMDLSQPRICPNPV